MKNYDLIVIGSGPGGYVCAIKASQLGLKTAIIEKNDNYGGTCLNIGCIPSKALLHASEEYNKLINNKLNKMGINYTNVNLNLTEMMKYKEKIVNSNIHGISYLLKKNKIDIYHGLGSILSPNTVNLTCKYKNIHQTLHTKNIVIATGSTHTTLPNINIDEKNILSSTGALSLQEVPKKLSIIGGGIIGLELGSVWNRLGSEVTIIEFANKILSTLDFEISKYFQSILNKQGIKFLLSTKLITINNNNNNTYSLVLQSENNDSSYNLNTNKVLIAVGRKPYINNLNIKNIGILLDKNNRIITNSKFETNIKNIYAIGDVISGPMLAHKAEEEGVAVAEIINGESCLINYNIIPNVIYTNPEVACIGKTEQELKSKNIQYKIGKFYFTANGRAKATDHTEGFVKIITNSITDKVLGVHIIGHGAGDMIHEAAVLMEFHGSAEDLARICHAHPTMSEAIKEAALAAFYKPIHC